MLPHSKKFQKPLILAFEANSALFCENETKIVKITHSAAQYHSAVQLCTIVHRISVYLSLYLSYLFALTQIVVVVVQKVKALDFQKYFIMLFRYYCGEIYSLYLYNLC